MGPTKGGNILYSKSDFFYFFPELLGLIPDCFPKPEAIVASAISDK